MFIKVDDPRPQGEVEGFSYTNAIGYEEHVILNTPENVTVFVRDSIGAKAEIYIEDIAKLIMALQAAEKHARSLINE